MEKADVYAASRRIAIVMTPPLARTFWHNVSRLVLAGADGARRVYTGDGQLYAILILFYFIVLYAASGVFTPG
jgi:hypothetical protein